MKRLATTLVVAALVATTQAAGWEASGQSYESQTAAQKQQYLWNQVT